MPRHIQRCVIQGLCPQEAHDKGGEKKYSGGTIFAQKKNRKIDLLPCENGSGMVYQHGNVQMYVEKDLAEIMRK